MKTAATGTEMASEHSILDILHTEQDKKEVQTAQLFLKSLFMTREGLKRLEVLRSDTLTTADYIEWLVAKVLRGERARKNEKGFDVWAGKKRYEVKSRLFTNGFSTNTKFHVTVRDTKEFDFLVCVFLASDYDILAIFQISYENLKRITKPDPKIAFRRTIHWHKKYRASFLPYVTWIWPDKDKVSMALDKLD